MGRVRLIYERPYSIHGTEAYWSLGLARSYGSMRLGNPDAIELATLIMEAACAGKPGEWYARVLRDRETMVQVKLPRPILLLNVD